MRRSWLGATVLCLLGVLLPMASAAASSSGRVGAAGDAPEAMPACTTSVATSYGKAPVKVTIAHEGAVGCVTFTGTMGDFEISDIAQTSGSVSPFFDLFDPSGISSCAGPYSNPADCDIGQTGRWTIEITDNAGTHTGSMNVAIQRTDSAQNCKTIVYGPTTVTGDIKAPAGIACYTFKQKTAGVVYVHEAAVKGTVGSPDIVLGAPDGTECGPSGGTLECPITDTGTQSLLFYTSSKDTGTFDLSTQLLTKPVQCPTVKKNGATLSSAIDKIAQVRCFEFAGKKGESVTLTVSKVTGTLESFMDLFNPSGTSTLAGPGTTISDSDLSAAGNWVILVQDSTGEGTGKFDIALT
jgi:hypothetical protein